MNPTFEAFVRGAINQPRPGRIHEVAWNAFRPRNLGLLVECIAEALTRPIDERNPKEIWTAVRGATPGDLSKKAVFPLKQPPECFEDLLLIDFSTLDAESLKAWPAFRARLAVELRIRSQP